MTSTTNKTVMAGVSVVLAAVLAVVGVGVIDSANLTTEFSLDTQSEWNNYAASLNGVVVTSNGNVELDTGNTSGTYQSVALDANESNSSFYNVYTNVPEPDNSSVSLVVDGNTYELDDGKNKVELDSQGSSFSLEFQRDSTSVSTPQVDKLVGLSGSKSGLLRLVGLASFGLLLLLVLLQYMNFGRSGRN